MKFKIEVKEKYTKEDQKANAEIWAQALESGEFGQTKRVLKNAHGNYCCLGVLECLTGGAFIKTDDGDFLSARNLLSDFPSEIAYQSVGLHKTVMYEGYYASMDTHLSSLNDDGKKFKTIAKEIRKYLTRD